MASRNYQLVMRSGPTPGRIYPLDQDEIHIGRDISNHVVISDAEVSRHHARLIAQGNSYVLEDQGSTNGTFVDGQRLMGPHLLHPGELILFGENVSLAFEPGDFDPDATRAAHVSVDPQYRVDRWPEPEPQEPEEGSNQAPRQVSPPAPQVFEAPRQAPRTAPPPAFEQDYRAELGQQMGNRQEPPHYETPQYQEPRYEPPRFEAPRYEQPQYEQPRYSGSVPPGPVEAYPAQPTRGERIDRRWIYAGCGCLVVLLCVVVAAVYAFDTMNLYCTPPFNALFSCP